MTVSKQELRPDGILLYNQRSADGHDMWVKFVYSEISEPEKLVFTNSFSDEEGNTVRAPFNETWPLEVLNTLTFTEQDGKTTLTLRGFPLSATEEEHQTFEASQEMVQQGYGGTLDQLAEYLATT